MAGLTLVVIVGAVPLNALPSDSVPLIVPLPVTVSVKIALWPLQIVVFPLITEVGRAFTVTLAVFPLDTALEQLLAFLIDVIVTVVEPELASASVLNVPLPPLIVSEVMLPLETLAPLRS